MGYILLFILPIAYAQTKHDGITISIEPESAEAHPNIKHEGQDVKLLTDKDISAFNLTKDVIEKAVKLYSGEKPTDVFIKSPTPWGDLYKSYQWREVKREFKIKDIRLINVTQEEKTLSKRDYSNHANETKVTKGETLDYYDSFHSRHYWSGNENISARVFYHLVRPDDPLYSSDVGQDSFGSGVTAITFTENRATFNLEPEQTATFYVKGNQVTVRLLVDYETILSGDIAVNYENKLGGHHFWAYDINEVLSASNLATIARTSEYVEVTYLGDFKIQIVDAESGKDIEFKNHRLANTSDSLMFDDNQTRN